MTELPTIAAMLRQIEALRVENERLRNTLIVFSDPLSWRRDGVCDPNSGAFKGQQIANDALSQ